jgi:hypothetical protein
MVRSLAWLPDSRRLLTASHDGRLRHWTLPETSAAAAWLPDLAEALAGKRDDRENGSVAASMERLNALRQLALTNRVDSPEQPWLRWFLVERLQSPGRRPQSRVGPTY